MDLRIATLSLSALLSLACGPSARTAGNTSRPPTASPARASSRRPADTAVQRRESVALSFAMHETIMTEVVLDPRGEYALTLDADGGLRLWPSVRGTAVAVPVVLPEREPVWSTLARAEDGTFVVATIDTQGGARVARIALGEGSARRTELFEIPAVDPQFELHVLDGAERIVALGKDHRVRVLDTAGNVRAEIDRVGFIPWQLRVAPTKDGVTPMIAVLTQPVRAQSIRLEGDELTVVGDAHMVALDQSPNRNDLALSNDGTKVAALRRPSSRGRAFALQLIDMASGERKVILGELDANVRPRLHLVDDARALLETGTGKGFWLELSAAVPKAQAEIPLTPVSAVPLPGATEDLRMQVTVVAGIRAVPTPGALVIDPLESPEHTRLSAKSVGATAIALDARGERVVWSSGDRIVIERIGGEARSFDVSGVQRLAMHGDELAIAGKRELRTAELRELALGDLRAGATASQWPELASTSGRARRRLAESQTAGLALAGGRLLRSDTDPSGRFIAVVERAGSSTVDFAGISGHELRLGVYDAKSHARLWTRPMHAVEALAWSGTGDRLAIAGAGVRVIDVATGDTLLVRTDTGVLATTRSDAEQ